MREREGRRKKEREDGRKEGKGKEWKREKIYREKDLTRFYSIYCNSKPYNI